VQTCLGFATDCKIKQFSTIVFIHLHFCRRIIQICQLTAKFDDYILLIGIRDNNWKKVNVETQKSINMIAHFDIHGTQGKNNEKLRGNNKKLFLIINYNFFKNLRQIKKVLKNFILKIKI